MGWVNEKRFLNVNATGACLREGTPVNASVDIRIWILLALSWRSKFYKNVVHADIFLFNASYVKKRKATVCFMAFTIGKVCAAIRLLTTSQHKVIAFLRHNKLRQ